MVVSTIYVTRHGFRGNWTLDPQTGTYATNTPSPTGIASDPALAAYGVLQAEQLVPALLKINDPPITRVYSSPFYRCLQTLEPFVKRTGLEIRGDYGLGEWYGLARFTHPSPASPSLLHSLFPSYSLTYAPSIIPSTNGESVADLHDRIAYALQHTILYADAEDHISAEPDPLGPHTAILICTHAASMIAIGRALTGRIPEDVCEDDFKTFTCSISKFERRNLRLQDGDAVSVRSGISRVDWKDGKGVLGGWNCVVNGDCSHLEGGEERGCGIRHFQGDEAFNDDDDGTSDREDEPQGDDDDNKARHVSKL